MVDKTDLYVGVPMTGGSLALLVISMVYLGIGWVLIVMVGTALLGAGVYLLWDYHKESRNEVKTQSAYETNRGDE